MEVTKQPESGTQVVTPQSAAQPKTSQPIVEPKSEIPTTVETKLPAGTSERTAEQFDKLKDNNKRLYEANQLLQQELARKKQLEQQFKPVQTAVPQEQQPKIEQFIETDPVTGEQFVNEARLKGAITEAQNRATRAEQTVQSYITQQQQREEQKQTEEAYKAYPDLNPHHDKYDVELTKKTRAFLLDSMVNPQDYNGRPLTFREAADVAKMQLGGQPKPAPVVTEEPKKEEAKEAKIQASAGAEGVSSTMQRNFTAPDEELAKLQKQTRMGDAWAIARRLTKVSHSVSVKGEES